MSVTVAADYHQEFFLSINKSQFKLCTSMLVSGPTSVNGPDFRPSCHRPLDYCVSRGRDRQDNSSEDSMEDVPVACSLNASDLPGLTNWTRAQFDGLMVASG